MGLGCFFTFSSALGSVGTGVQASTVFWRVQKEVAVINPMWVSRPGLQWMEVETQQERKESSLTHELESGSGFTVYTSDNARVTPSK